MEKHINIFSFFSGIGILDLGFEKAGCEVVFVNEISEPFLYGYKYSRKIMGIDEPKHGYYLGGISDLMKGKNKKVLAQYINESRRHKALVGFIGGPPCPDFSVGGKNKGRLGENGKLSSLYINIICQQKPDFFLFENVKGLWKTKKHRQYYEEIKKKVKKAGYLIAERLINAIEYGAPQDRERIILFGVKKKIAKEKGIKYDIKSMTISDGGFPWLKYAKYPDRKAFNYPWVEKSGFKQLNGKRMPDNIPAELTVGFWFDRNDVENHRNSGHCFTPRNGLKKFEIIDEGDVSKKSYKRLHRWRYSPTAAYGNNEVHLHPYKARRLSVSEVLAIQSLPKEYCLPKDMTLSNMYKSIGNGVPYLAAKSLAKSIKTFMGGK